MLSPWTLALLPGVDEDAGVFGDSVLDDPEDDRGVRGLSASEIERVRLALWFTARRWSTMFDDLTLALSVDL